MNVLLATQDRIVIVDPMGEYSPLVRRLGGQVIEIAPDSPHHINPMDIEMGMNDEDSPLPMKAFAVRAGGGRQGRTATHREDRD